jgi:hypothetical protein
LVAGGDELSRAGLLVGFVEALRAHAAGEDGARVRRQPQVVGDGGEFVLGIAAGGIVVGEDVLGPDGGEEAGVKVSAGPELEACLGEMVDAGDGANVGDIDVAAGIDLGPAIVGEAAIEGGSRQPRSAELLDRGEAGAVHREHVMGCRDAVGRKHEQSGDAYARKAKRDPFLVEPHRDDGRDNQQGQEIAVKHGFGERAQEEKAAVADGEWSEQKHELPPGEQ